MKNLHRLTAVEAAQAIEQGSLSCEALARACLQRIAERNAEIRAFTAWDEQRAIAEARRADQGAARGVLRGIPFAVKDLIDTADHDTSYGSPIYAGHRPRADAACVALARERGAVLLGKVVTTEFATQTPSVTRNPLSAFHTPGGSSSGSAAAVADCMVPVAFGTQTTASIIRPAAYCGVVGYKPTFGLISAAGVKPLSPSQDTVGVLARDIADAAFLAFGLQGWKTLLAVPGRPRIGVCVSSQWQHAGPAMVEAMESLATRAEREGATVSRIRLPKELEELIGFQPRLFAYEAQQALAHERIHHWGLLSRRLQERLAGGMQIDPSDYLRMRARAQQGRHALRELFAGVDALLYPAVEGEAEPDLDNTGSARFGALWTLLHAPLVCLPAGTGPNGLPLGVQVIGAPHDDARLLAVAEFVRRASLSRNS